MRGGGVSEPHPTAAMPRGMCGTRAGRPDGFPLRQLIWALGLHFSHAGPTWSFSGSFNHFSSRALVLRSSHFKGGRKTEQKVLPDRHHQARRELASAVPSTPRSHGRHLPIGFQGKKVPAKQDRPLDPVSSPLDSQTKSEPLALPPHKKPIPAFSPVTKSSIHLDCGFFVFTVQSIRASSSGSSHGRRKQALSSL